MSIEFYQTSIANKINISNKPFHLIVGPRRCGVSSILMYLLALQPTLIARSIGISSFTYTHTDELKRVYKKVTASALPPGVIWAPAHNELRKYKGHSIKMLIQDTAGCLTEEQFRKTLLLSKTQSQYNPDFKLVFGATYQQAEETKTNKLFDLFFDQDKDTLFNKDNSEIYTIRR